MIVEEKKAKTPNIVVDGITLDLLDDCVRLHLGSGVYKFITYENLIDKLQSTVTKETVKTKREELWLPGGTYYQSVSSAVMNLACYYPECVRNIRFETTSVKTAMEIVVPNIIITHELTKATSNQWKVTNSKYLVTNKSLAEIERRFPNKSDPDMDQMCFTNVYNDARLCYGENVRVSEVNLPDLRPLNWYYEILFVSPFNNDLGLPTLHNSTFREYPVKWYEHLAKCAKDKAPFPYQQITKFK